MGTQSTKEASFYVKKRMMKRVRNPRPMLLFMAVSFLLCFSGGVLLFSGVLQTWASAAPERTHIVTRLHSRSTRIMPSTHSTTTAPSPTPIPPVAPTETPFVPQVGPEPVSPFPLYVKQQVYTLEVKDRFFYHGNFALPEIALTFDDGPNPSYTAQILSILKQYNVKASFFCMGSHTQEHPELVKQESDDGHLIGNHTWTHPHLTTLSAQQIASELTSTGDILQKVTGTRPTYFRPPYGEFDAHVLPEVNKLGLTTFMWGLDAKDWTMPASSIISARIVNASRNGTIILLHDGGGNRSNTVAALPTIIEHLQARGFRFVKLDQLVADAHRLAAASSDTGITSTPIQNPLSEDNVVLADVHAQSRRETL